MSSNGCTSSGGTVVNSGGFVTINTQPTFYIPTSSPLTWPIPDFDLNVPEIELDLPFKQCKIKVGNAEGYECTGCQDFYPMAELNQPDNAKNYTKFTCYSCRNGLSIIYKKE